MSFRWLEVLCTAGQAHTVRAAAEAAGVSEIVRTDCDDGRCLMRLLTGAIDRQGLIDDLHDRLEGDAALRLVLVPVEAVTPQTEEEQERQEASLEQQRKDSITASREEVFQQVAQGAALGRDYLMLVMLSTLVAAVGLARNDLAVLIGAMLIAPLLGPYLAVAFASSVGDRRLLLRGLKSAAVGLALTVALAALVPFAVAGDLDSGLLERTARVGLGSVVLPLASGAAAALSITSRVSSLLVGVMVSSALLPPATALGIALNGLAWDSVAGAGLLLSVNVVAVTLAAILTFTAKGIRPRTWYERAGASQSLRTTLPLLALALAGLVAVIAVTPRYLLG